MNLINTRVVLLLMTLAVTLVSMIGQAQSAERDAAIGLIDIQIVNPGLILWEGATRQYSAVGVYDDGTTNTITDSVIWSSSNTDVATIKAGLVAGLSVGTTEISANLGKISSGNVPLMVKAVTFDSIEITPNSNGYRRVLKGNTKDFQALGNFSDGSVKDITEFSRTRWTSSDTSVATVKKGTVTGKGSGTATITVNNRGVETSFVVTVYGLETNNVRSISISPDNAFIHYGHTQSYTVTANLFPVGTKTVTQLVKWTVGDGNIVSISSNGLATGLGIGNTTLTAEYEGVTAQVTVHGVGKSPVLQTGQTNCYDENGNSLGSCVGTGQDGELQSGLSLANRWTVSGDCITDNLTGLMWAKPGMTGMNTPLSWTDAKSEVLSIQTCGHYDWRMPNLNELRSLINYGEANPADYLERQGFFFSNFLSTVWTSTNDFRPGLQIFFNINMATGLISSSLPEEYLFSWAVREVTPSSSTLPETGQNKCHDHYSNVIPCTTSYGMYQDGQVRAGVSWPNPRFEITGSDQNCVTDLLTGLTWMRTPFANTYIWQGALDVAETTHLCGLNNWRLPSINELGSLMHQGYPDFDESLPSRDYTYLFDYLNDNNFSGITNTTYWSSTTVADDPAKAWTLDMSGSGIMYRDYKSHGYQVWLVHGRKNFD